MKKRMIAKFIAVFAILTLVTAMALTLSACKKEAKYTVGICQWAPHPALDEATRGFKEQLEKELGKDVGFIENNAEGDPGICTVNINNLVSRKVDLIMANATPALIAATAGTQDIPILGTSVTEYGIALEIDNFDGLVGGNISGTSDLAHLDRQANMIKEIFPNAKNVALLYCSSEPNSAYQIKVIKAELDKLGLNCKEFAFAEPIDIQSQANAAAEWCDVIYVPTDNTAASGAETIRGAIGKKPLIAGEENLCKGCGVATLTLDYYDLGVTTGKMAAKILRGEDDISKMKIEYADKFTKKYNAERCREVGVDTAELDQKGYVAIDVPEK